MASRRYCHSAERQLLRGDSCHSGLNVGGLTHPGEIRGHSPWLGTGQHSCVIRTVAPAWCPRDDQENLSGVLAL